MSLTSSLLAGVDVERLGRGVNLSHWYAQWSTYDEDRLSNHFSETDVKLVADMGFTHVRLTLSDVVLFDPSRPGVLRDEPLQKLRQRIGRFIDHKLVVVVDLHPEEPYKKSLQDDPNHADNFVKDWAALARALSDTDPAWVALEVMNEPEPNKGEAWRALQHRAVKGMRASAPKHTIIVAPGAWTSLKDLLEFKPYDDPNLIYTFHFYDPHLYTHQAATWAWYIAKEVKNLDWPIPVSDARSASAAATELPEGRKHLTWQIEQGLFTREWIAEEFDKVVAWRKANGDVPVYLGEFGVYAKAAPRAGRLRWYQAVREEAEARGIGWAIWDYAGGFQVTTGEPRHRTADNELVKALGLRP